MKTTSNSKRLNLIASLAALTLASSASFAAGTISQAPTPKPGPFGDPIINLPFEEELNPIEFEKPNNKNDEPPIPLGYVDIPEIDRSDDDGGVGDPLGSVSQPEPVTPITPVGDIFPRLDGIFFNPLAPGVGIIYDYGDTYAGSESFYYLSPTSLDGSKLVAAPFNSIPAPGTLFVGGLAIGSMLRRKR